MCTVRYSCALTGLAACTFAAAYSPTGRRIGVARENLTNFPLHTRQHQFRIRSA